MSRGTNGMGVVGAKDSGKWSCSMAKGEGKDKWGRVESDYRRPQMFKLAPPGSRGPGRACGLGHGVIRLLFSRINVVWSSE